MTHGGVQEKDDKGEKVFRGPRVRMGIHWAVEGTVANRSLPYTSSVLPALPLPLPSSALPCPPQPLPPALSCLSCPKCNAPCICLSAYNVDAVTTDVCGVFCRHDGLPVKEGGSSDISQ